MLKKKITKIVIKLIPGIMHRRAHIKDPASSPQVIQIQSHSKNDSIKKQWDNEKVYGMSMFFNGEVESTHIMEKPVDDGTCT
jgi:hypothetical protein